MTSPILRITASVLLLLAVASCRTAPLYNVENASLSTPASASVEDVERAIIRAGAQLGWQMSKQTPGHIVARLPVRSHLAVTDIRYTKETLSITYKDSTNLHYDAGANVIHSNYNGWVQRLQNSIVAQVSAL